MVRRIQVTGLFIVTPEAISTPECICMFQAKVWVVACRHAPILHLTCSMWCCTGTLFIMPGMFLRASHNGCGYLMSLS